MKRVLITGASEGIGRSFAKKFAELGFHVTAVARTTSRLEDLIRELSGDSHSFLALDLASESGVSSLLEHLDQITYDVVINNAGFGAYGTFAGSHADFDKMMQLNCITLTRVSHAYLSKARPGDALINVSSIASILTMPYAAFYSATKGYVTALTEALWAESKSRGVYVMCLCPGATRTLFHETSGGRNETMPRWASQTPDQVADIALHALKKRSQPLVLCGTQKWAVFISRFLPVKITLTLSEKILKKALAP